MRFDYHCCLAKFRNVALAGLTILLTFAAPAFGRLQKESESEQEKQVRRLVAAFNDRDISRMHELLDEDVKWLTISGEKITVETTGKKALGERMVAYFRNCNDCKSSLDWVQTKGNRVLAMERASWRSKTALKSHASLSVYEFRNQKILRVYYFAGPESMH